MECSNRGICNRDTGLCVCQDIFEGNACERLKCPSGSNGKTCSGYGVCATMSEIASLRVVNGELTPTTYGSVANDLNTWDAHRLQGCICNSRTHAYASPSTGHVPTWSGYDCSVRGCPRGPRPPPDHESCVYVKSLSLSSLVSNLIISSTTDTMLLRNKKLYAQVMVRLNFK